MVFWKGAVPEGLVDFYQRASGKGLAVGGFRAGVRHGGNKKCDFGIFLSRPQQAFAAPYIL